MIPWDRAIGATGHMSRLIKIADWSGEKRGNVVFVHGVGGQRRISLVDFLVDRHRRFSEGHRRSQSLKTAFGDAITGFWTSTTLLDPAQFDNLRFCTRAIWQSGSAYPIATSKVLHEIALIVVHRFRAPGSVPSPQPIRRTLGAYDTGPAKVVDF